MGLQMKNFLNSFGRSYFYNGVLCLLIFATSESCKQSSSFSGNSSKRAAQQIPKEEPLKPQATPQYSPQPVQTQPPVVVPNAIVKGSFTVWANPESPAEGQDYNIHIRVKLPSNLTSYSRSDLSGILTGTDGYSQIINGFLTFLKQSFVFTPGSGYAELVMPIPGAARGVDDTLKVSSQLISESQTIVVHFN
jgi:hypothetical protein